MSSWRGGAGSLRIRMAQGPKRIVLLGMLIAVFVALGTVAHAELSERGNLFAQV